MIAIEDMATLLHHYRLYRLYSLHVSTYGPRDSIHTMIIREKRCGALRGSAAPEMVHAIRYGLADAQDNLNGQLVQLLIFVATFCQRVDIELSLFELFGCLCAVTISEQATVGLVATIDFLQERL